MRMFTAPVTFLNLAGYTVAFLVRTQRGCVAAARLAPARSHRRARARAQGVCWYNYLKLNQAKAKAASKAAAATTPGVADEEAPDTSKEPGLESKGTQ